jgi:hypothetical protein
LRALLARLLLPFWVVLYFILTNPLLVALSFFTGLVPFVVIMIAIGTAWSIVFYLLLSVEGSLEKVQHRFQEKGWISKFKGKKFWIYLIFVFGGGLLGVIALKSLRKGSLRSDFWTLLLGSILGALPLVAILGLALTFLPWEMIRAWLSGWLS